MHYEVYREPSSNLWCWTLYDERGRMLARNVEKYYNKEDCFAAVDVVKHSRSIPVSEK
jgi:uncharacterized protein YegP (UPF0339 family)